MMAVFLAGSAYASNCQTDTLKTVFKFVADRAQLMKFVAADKYEQKKPAYAAAQEIKVLNRVEQIAKDQGLPVYPLLIFAQVQMDLSKYIEEYWLDQWRKDPASYQPDKMSLAQLRNEIGQIDAKLYPAIKDALESLKRCSLSTSSKLFLEAMKPVKGVPQEPDYTQIMLQALIGVAQNAQ